MKFSFKIQFIIFLILSISIQSPHVSAEIVDMVAAQVNEEVILLSDVRMKIKQISGMMQIKEITDKEKEEMEKNILNALIEERLLVQHAENLKFEIPDEEINKTVATIRRENNLSESQFEEALERDGILMDDYRKILKEQKMISILMNQEINSRVHIDESEKQEYYKKNRDSFVTQEEARVRHILFLINEDSSQSDKVLARKRAEDIISRIKKGEDFAELAKLYSEDGSAKSGGDLGFFTRGKMIKDFEDIAFELAPGEVSGIVKTGFGYHIIKCEEKKESAPRKFEDVLTEIENKIFGEKAGARKDAFMEKLKEGAIIERRI